MKMYRPHRLCPRNSKPKEPSLYRSLCVSILCMFLSTVMLVGTTMAWFSDSLQTGVYTITSANFSTTVYYCTDLSDAEGVPNNWQRLNPSNTTLFGGGSLSSADGQVAYLKLVSNSTIPLKYKFTLTASEETGNIGNLSLAGCQSKKPPEGVDVALTESDLITANPTPDSYSPQEVVFDVPAATKNNSPVTVYAVLKLTCSSTEQTTYKFALKLDITQLEGDVTQSNSLLVSTQFTPSFSETPQPAKAPGLGNNGESEDDSNGSNDDVLNGDGSSNDGTIESGSNGDANNGGNNDNDSNNDVANSEKPAGGEGNQSVDPPAATLS